jgi:hypothetical protein
MKNMQLLAEPASELSQEILHANPGALREDFNRRSFLFSHSLAEHPLFELPRLADLATRILGEPRKTKGVHWHGQGVGISTKWSEVQVAREMQLVCDAIANIEASGSWVLLYSVQSSPEFKVLLDRALRDIEVAVGEPLLDRITWSDAYIFLASPHAVTPFHIDHESTFLFQIHGRRTANIWDQSDRSIITDQELENYYLGDLSAANYHPDKQPRAMVYDLQAGKGVHHPSCAPHAFTNGDTYSVAMGVHFCLRDLDRRARVYQANGVLRKFGVCPTPPGQSSLQDGLKSRLVGLFSDRKPETKSELLRSGINRILRRANAIRGLVRKPKRGSA